jgi:hypothetical protein
MLPEPLPLSLHAPVLGQSRRHPTPHALPDRHRMPPPSLVRRPLPPPCALPGHPRPPPAHCSVTPWRSLTAAHAWPSLGSHGLYRSPPVPCPAWPPPRTPPTVSCAQLDNQLPPRATTLEMASESGLTQRTENDRICPWRIGRKSCKEWSRLRNQKMLSALGRVRMLTGGGCRRIA